MKAAHLLLCLALAGCVTSQPERRPATDQRINAALVPPALALDTLPASPPPHTPALAPAMWMRRALRSFRDNVPQPAGVPRKCKQCNFVIVTGNGNKVSQASAGKVKAAANLASDSATATDQRAATNAVSGTGITATQTNTAPKPPTVAATIAAKLTGPLGYVLAAVAVAGVCYGIWWLLPLLPRRRKDNDTPTV